jgi:hypothetical protein
MFEYWPKDQLTQGLRNFPPPLDKYLCIALKWQGVTTVSSTSLTNSTIRCYTTYVNLAEIASLNKPRISHYFRTQNKRKRYFKFLNRMGRPEILELLIILCPPPSRKKMQLNSCHIFESFMSDFLLHFGDEICTFISTSPSFHISLIL